jgi:hypothetical protein
MSFFSHRTRRGVTFIELIGVLVVAIIIIAGALALYSEANTSSRTNQLLVAIGALTGSVRALHANAANYGGGISDRNGSVDEMANLENVLVNANAVPPGLLITGEGTDDAPYVINHAFGGAVRVKGAGQLFAVAAQGLDQDICIRVATESTAKASSGLRGVYVGNLNGGDNKNKLKNGISSVTKASETTTDPVAPSEGEGIFIGSTTTGIGSGTLPISPAGADTACENASNNNIVWVFQ